MNQHTAKLRDWIPEDEQRIDVCRSWVVDEKLNDQELARRLKESIAPEFPLGQVGQFGYEQGLFHYKGEAVLTRVDWGDLAKAVRALVS